MRRPALRKSPGGLQSIRLPQSGAAEGARRSGQGVVLGFEGEAAVAYLEPRAVTLGGPARTVRGVVVAAVLPVLPCLMWCFLPVGIGFQSFGFTDATGLQDLDPFVPLTPRLQRAFTAFLCGGCREPSKTAQGALSVNCGRMRYPPRVFPRRSSIQGGGSEYEHLL